MSAIPAVGHVSVRSHVPEDYYVVSISCRRAGRSPSDVFAAHLAKLWMARWLVRQIYAGRDAERRCRCYDRGVILPGGVALLLRGAGGGLCETGK